MNRLFERFYIVFAWLCGVLILGSVLIMAIYIINKGAGTINAKLFFGETDPFNAIFFRERVFDGLFPAVVGTLILVTLSITFAVPAGVGAGIWLSEYAGEGIREFFGLLVDILAGIPSIVVGLFGFSLSIFLHKNFSGEIYPCLLISAFSLAILVLPYLINATQASLSNVGKDLRRSVKALGATKLQGIAFVLVPESLSGILSGIALSVGRCAEDTAVIMLTGAVAMAGVPGSVWDNYEALPFYIYYNSSEYTTAQELETGFGASLVLVLMCCALYLFSAYIKRRFARSYHQEASFG